MMHSKKIERASAELIDFFCVKASESQQFRCAKRAKNKPVMFYRPLTPYLLHPPEWGRCLFNKQIFSTQINDRLPKC